MDIGNYPAYPAVHLLCLFLLFVAVVLVALCFLAATAAGYAWQRRRQARSSSLEHYQAPMPPSSDAPKAP